MEKYPKFIIEGESLILMKVTFHKEIATDTTKVRGGGWYKFLNDKNMIVFYGESHDFGKSTLEDIKKCIENGNVFCDKWKHKNIIDRHSFGYDTGSEIIELKK